MASEEQVAANRADDASSDGANTPQRNENSRQNAVKHGLLARTVTALGEADEAFLRYHVDLMGILLPQNPYEFTLVRRLAQLGWRLDRLNRMEAALLDGVANRNETARARRAATDGATRHLFPEKPADDLWTSELSQLGRYETQLDHAFKRNMLLLERHRADRAAVKKAASRPISSRDASDPAYYLSKIPNETRFADAPPPADGAASRAGC